MPESAGIVGEVGVSSKSRPGGQLAGEAGTVGIPEAKARGLTIMSIEAPDIQSILDRQRKKVAGISFCSVLYAPTHKQEPLQCGDQVDRALIFGIRAKQFIGS